MAGEVKININGNNSSKIECLRSKHKEQLGDLKSLLGSISKIKNSLPEKEMFSVLIKKFIYTIVTVPDNYFLSDVCELTHELFIEFRMALGYLENQSKNNGKKLQMALEDIETISKDIYGLYKDFLSDPGYSGTNFPKPKKIKAMRQLEEAVKDVGDVVILNKKKFKETTKSTTNPSNTVTSSKTAINPFANISKASNTFKQENRHVAIDIPENRPEPTPDELRELINSFSLKYAKSDDFESFAVDSTVDTSSLSDSTSTDSFNPTVNMSKSYTTPLTPRLYSEELSAIKTTTVKTGKGSDAVLVAAMGELMGTPPRVPKSGHGRVLYVDAREGGRGQVPVVPKRRSQQSQSSGLRPPILVDDDGDILPANGPSLPQLKSAAASIYESSNGRIIVDIDPLRTPKGFTPRGSQSAGKLLEDADDDDDSFIVAYREYAMREGEVGRNVVEENKKMAGEMESSGWSMKNRI